MLTLAHDGSGHLGVRKTYDRILRHFFWPSMKKDACMHLRTCSTCQLTGKPNHVIKPAPLLPIPAICPPFEYLIIDLCGTTAPCEVWQSVLTDCHVSKHQVPAVYPLRTITARSVVRALTQFISFWHSPSHSE